MKVRETIMKKGIVTTLFYKYDITTTFGFIKSWITVGKFFLPYGYGSNEHFCWS